MGASVDIILIVLSIYVAVVSSLHQEMCHTCITCVIHICGGFGCITFVLGLYSPLTMLV